MLVFFLMTYSSDNDVNVWHSRLEHIRQQRMNRLAKKGLLGPLKIVNLLTCPNFLERKMKKKNHLEKQSELKFHCN